MDVAGPDATPAEGLPPGEQAKLRFYFASGSVIGGLGVLALAGGEFRTGATSLIIGLAALILGVKRGQGLVAGAVPTEPKAKAKTPAKAKTSAKSKTGAKAKAKLTTETAAFTAWYTVGLGLVLMGAGATTTVFARESDTTTAEIVLFLVAGVLLWMGVTCLIAARVKVRGREGTVPKAPKRPRPAVSGPEARAARTRPPRRPGASK